MDRLLPLADDVLYTYPGGVEQTVQGRLEQRQPKDFGAIVSTSEPSKAVRCKYCSTSDCADIMAQLSCLKEQFGYSRLTLGKMES